MEPDARDMEDVNACTKSMFVLLLQYSKGFETQWDEKHKFIEEIKKLNYQYRKKNKATDVISFGEDINEIVICPEEVKKNGSDFNKELKEVVIHGVLHLLGYDHEQSEEEATKMFNKQNKYLKIN